MRLTLVIITHLRTSIITVKGESGIATPSHIMLISYFPGTSGIYENLTCPISESSQIKSSFEGPFVSTPNDPEN